MKRKRNQQKKVKTKETNVYGLCRICAHEVRKVSMVHIFSSDGLERQLPDKINCHLPIKVSKNDGYPQLICQPCGKKLDACHALVNTCIEGNEKIQQLITNMATVLWLPDADDGQVKNLFEPDTEKAIIPQRTDYVETFNEETSFEDFTTSYAMDDGHISDVSMKDTKNEENDDTVSASEAGNRDDGIAVNQDEALLDFGCVKAEIAIVAVSYTQTNEIQDLDVAPELFLVCMDKNEVRNYKESVQAAQNSVNLMCCTEGVVSKIAANYKKTKSRCRICNKKLPLNVLHQQSKNQEIKCEECNKLNEKETETKTLITFLERVTSYIETSLKAFKEKPSANLVMNLGCYSATNRTFNLTSYSSDKAHSYVQVEKTVFIHESLFNKSCVPESYYCGVCDRAFPFDREHFTKHLIEEHFGIQDIQTKLPLNCIVCAKKLTTKTQLKNHVAHQHKTNFEEVVCDECGKLVVKHRLPTHKYGHLRKECMYCHQMLAPRTWSRHKRFQENPKAERDKKISCIIQRPKKKIGPYFIMCDFCGKEIEKKRWIYHSAYQRLFGPNVQCPENFPVPEQEQLDPDRQNMFQSALKDYDNAWKLKIAEINGTTNTYNPAATKPKIECTYCHKMISHLHYNIHMNMHKGNCPYQCSYCEKKWASKSMLASHVKFVHLKLGLNCQYCNMFFSRKTKLLAHEALHRGERNFKCPYCPKYFPGQPNVNGHIKLVHEGRYKDRKRNKKKETEQVIVQIQSFYETGDPASYILI